MKKPIIGVTSLIDLQKASYWMLPGYLKGLTLAGALPVVLPLEVSLDDIKTLADTFDGFLFTGGQDVNPEIYKQEKSPLCGEISEARDKFEYLLLHEVIKRNKPILGICRGIQFINAYFGGTLYQDLDTEHPSKTEHHMSAPYDRGIHSVSLTDGAPLKALLKKDTLFVNSYHHQAIKELGSSLKTTAVSEDGLIEGIYAPDKNFLWAVQWHPEFSYEKDADSRKIFEAFVKASLQKRFL